MSSALEEAADRAHARSAGYRRRCDIARRRIEAAPLESICSVSWGKDSVALLSLVAEVRPDMPVMHYRWPAAERPASLDAVRDAMIARLGLDPRLPDWERPGAEAKVGLPPRGRGSDLRPSRPSCQPSPSRTPYLEVPLGGQTSAWYRLGRAWLEPRDAQEAAAWKAVMAENGERLIYAYRALGGTCSLIGMRADESRARSRHLAARGLEWHQAAWARTTIAPLGWWSGRDIWARHAECDLPSAAHYHQPGYERDRIRSEVTFAAAASTWPHGQGRFWSEADPDLWRRLVAAWPEVASW